MKTLVPLETLLIAAGRAGIPDPTPVPPDGPRLRELTPRIVSPRPLPVVGLP